MNTKKNILLTGASGTVGLEVLKQLAALTDRYNVTVFDIKNPRSERLFNRFAKGMDVVYGDLTDKNSVQNVCANKDVVIHLAALIPPVADDFPEKAYKVNVLGTKNLIESLEEKSPSAFFLYSSSISVYGDRVSNPNIKVGDPLVASVGDEYAKTKIEAENLIKKSKLNWSIFRLAAIMGNHKISKLMFHMPLNTPLEIATPEDTGRAFVNAIEKTAELNKRIFNLGGGETNRTTYKEFLQRSFEIFGLGELDFPENTFATANFHCGYYVDGDDLENIVHFRRDTLNTYFDKVRSKVNVLQFWATRLLKSKIKRNLLKKSEPLAALRENNKDLIFRFFGKNTV